MKKPEMFTIKVLEKDGKVTHYDTFTYNNKKDAYGYRSQSDAYMACYEEGTNWIDWVKAENTPIAGVYMWDSITNTVHDMVTDELIYADGTVEEGGVHSYDGRTGKSYINGRLVA